MSYILDALKKAEQERQRGSVPDLRTLQDDIIPKPRRRLRSGPVITLLLVIAAGTALWWFIQSSPGSKPAVRPPVGQQADPASQETSAAGQSSPTALPVRSEPLPEAEKQTTVINEISVDRPVVTLGENSRPQPAISRPVPRAVPKADLPAERPVQPLSRPAAPARAENPAVPPKPLSPEPLPSPDKLYALRDLPASVRKGLPPLSLSAFMYASDPAGRMVRVNDQMLHEGQDLSPGLRLQEITPDGVIFSYQGFRISVLMKPDQPVR
ncbi:MAG: general secretion pathway protein GspB [Thermodesulfovibrionales bacterium]